MNIQEYKRKIKYFIRKTASDEIYTISLIILVGFGGFGLGRLSVTVESKEPVRIIQNNDAAAVLSSTHRAQDTPTPSVALEGKYVASKSGTKYHFPWCGSASRIKEANRVWFDSKEDAQRAGYSPASNCKGLE